VQACARSQLPGGEGGGNGCGGLHEGKGGVDDKCDGGGGEGGGGSSGSRLDGDDGGGDISIFDRKHGNNQVHPDPEGGCCSANKTENDWHVLDAQGKCGSEGACEWGGPSPSNAEFQNGEETIGMHDLHGYFSLSTGSLVHSSSTFAPAQFRLNSAGNNYLDLATNNSPSSAFHEMAKAQLIGRYGLIVGKELATSRPHECNPVESAAVRVDTGYFNRMTAAVGNEGERSATETTRWAWDGDHAESRDDSNTRRDPRGRARTEPEGIMSSTGGDESSEGKTCEEAFRNNDDLTSQPDAIGRWVT